VNHHKVKVADEINYLVVTFESCGGWNRQKLKVIANENQTLVAIDKWLARTPDIRVKVLENVHEMLSEYTGCPKSLETIGILFIIYYYIICSICSPRHSTHFLSRFTMFVRISLNILGSTVAQQFVFLCLR
jgi:hypothetical protein